MQNYFETITQPVIAADFDYFRLPREKWGLMLARLAQLGATTLALTVPWGFHEIAAGTVDLDGSVQPRRDLLGLLDLAATLKFHCLLNLGPTHPDHGLLNQGLPAWLEHPDDQGEASPEAFERWFKTLSRALRDRQWPSGPIIALTLSDPVRPVSEALPAQLTEVKWPIWLRKRYKGIDALNTAYGTGYRTVSEVPFPQEWAQATTPPAQDARAFLAETQQERQDQAGQLLAEAGWQIPLYTPETAGQLPPLHRVSPVDLGDPARFEGKSGLIILQQPVQVEPDPIEIGQGPAWAAAAPIGPDGRLRRKFWTIRAWLWSQTLPGTTVAEGVLTVAADNGTLISSGQDVPLKVTLAKGVKPALYRLSLAGKLQTAEQLTLSRGKLAGLYLAEADEAQIDSLLVVDQPAAPLTGFTLAYLQRLLGAQAEALAGAATQAAQLGQALAPPAGKAGPSRSDSANRPLPYTLAEARRGLKEADVALRKAMASIGGLEVGFGTILGKPGSETTQAAPAPAIRPEIFEGAAREILIEVSETCLVLAPQLDATARTVRQAVENSGGLTVAQYQQAYSAATETAQRVRQPLLALIERLRAEIASEELPLVAWRVHDQVQALAEGLRWGVLRG